MKNAIQILLAGLVAVSFVGCASMSETKLGVSGPKPFGKTADGQSVEVYTLRNNSGMEARICTYGGIVTSLKVPDKNGNFADVVLGFDDVSGYTSDAYMKAMPYFGALIGRYGNRIAGGKFSLDGKEYTLPQNNNGNTLHGGPKGFDKVIWTAHPINSIYGPALELTYVSKDGEEGFPGNLTVKAIYAVTDKNELLCDFTATSDAHTVCNLTHHSYFNLRGSGDILDHVVMIDADKFTATDTNLIPTGELRSVEGTPFDFRKPTRIGERINDDNDQLKSANGYDQNWVLNKRPGEFARVAVVTEPSSGRRMEVWTTAPGMQFYTGNFLDGTLHGKHGQVYQFRDAFCMEPQGFPDSPNHPNFPRTDLKPGEVYRNTIIYKFSVQ